MLHMGVFSRLTRLGAYVIIAVNFGTKVSKFAHDNKRKHEERRI